MSAIRDEESCVYYCLFCGPCLSFQNFGNTITVHNNVYHPANWSPEDEETKPH